MPQESEITAEQLKTMADSFKLRLDAQLRTGKDGAQIENLRKWEDMLRTAATQASNGQPIDARCFTDANLDSKVYPDNARLANGFLTDTATVVKTPDGRSSTPQFQNDRLSLPVALPTISETQYEAKNFPDGSFLVSALPEAKTPDFAVLNLPGGLRMEVEGKFQKTADQSAIVEWVRPRRIFSV